VNLRGVKFYTHLSDQFDPFITKVISATANEAPHVLVCGRSRPIRVPLAHRRPAAFTSADDSSLP
jgi:Tn3 transposase DDE domain